MNCNECVAEPRRRNQYQHQHLVANTRPLQKRPLYLVVAGRIVKSPEPEAAITLEAYHNAFQPLPNRSISNTVCILPQATVDQGKHIHTQAIGWPNFGAGDKDRRQIFNYITIRPGEDYVVRHEICKSRIGACSPIRGEKCKVSLNDNALGTLFWCWGDLKDMEDKKFGDGPFTRRFFEENGHEWNEDYGREDLWLKGEDHTKLALVIKKGKQSWRLFEKASTT
ncbi:hypothetical protein DM02DRAFT_624584 [Periconia macrospinosa]|uniref:Uncharacterized protein n=1 Tax=Periconia macrospinosa TaxID=97972 RepID=A0A2V1E2W3_9PLEO|nr:hypothetical protein DM02DRAFT_624584 [Periconia macrospinosa]